ncbi:MAG: hypothetical protein KDK65_03900, partial [Chlamydiia bacterium]|nr:hypothetical protein [Chlamydiia bacterium]
QKTGSSAEVDYVIQFEGKVIPIEVKAGKTGHLRSLKQFMNTKPAPLGIHISEAPLSCKDRLLSVPFYLLSELPRLISAVS